MSEYETLEEVAQKFVMSPRRLRGIVKHHGLPVLRLGREIRFDSEAMAALQEAMGRPRDMAIAALSAEKDEQIPAWASTMLRVAAIRARRIGISFSLTKGDMADLIRQAGGKCTVTGITFRFERWPGSYRRPFAPSLDRRNSRGNYERRNVRLVCVAVNTALSDWGEPVFWEIVKAGNARRAALNAEYGR